jgi:hypothetical protein
MAKQKVTAPEKVYVEIEKDGLPIFVNADPKEANYELLGDNMLAEYRLVGFVRVTFQVVVTPVKA